MPRQSNDYQNGSPTRPWTPEHRRIGLHFAERFDSSPEASPTHVPNTSPASSDNGAATLVLEEPPALAVETAPEAIPETPIAPYHVQHRGAFQATSIQPLEEPIRIVDSHEFQNPWPEQQPVVPGSRPDVSHRCPHDLVYPCFCRQTAEKPGFVCKDCQYPLCSFNRLLHMGTTHMVQLELEREIARRRSAHQFQCEIEMALEHARERELEACARRLEEAVAAQLSARP